MFCEQKLCVNISSFTKYQYFPNGCRNYNITVFKSVKLKFKINNNYYLSAYFVPSDRAFAPVITKTSPTTTSTARSFAYFSHLPQRPACVMEQWQGCYMCNACTLIVYWKLWPYVGEYIGVNLIHCTDHVS